MITPHILIAQSNSFQQPLRLFQDSPGTTGIIIVAIFLGGMLTWFGFALMGYLHRKRLEQLPPILGNPKAMLDQMCTLVGLGISDRYVLTKVAFRMRLPQPASIILSPELLVQAAKIWHESHHFTPTQLWGINKLDHIARQVYEKSLSELGYKNPHS